MPVHILTVLLIRTRVHSLCEIIMILYRYLDFYGALKTLEDSSLKATRPIDYNDPFEYLVAVHPNRRVYQRFLADVPLDHMDEFISNQLKQMGIQKPTSKQHLQAAT